MKEVSWSVRLLENFIRKLDLSPSGDCRTVLWWLVVIAIIIGAIECLSTVICLIMYLWRKIARWPQNLMVKYGHTYVKDSQIEPNPETVWAVITGGSDGIGLAMAHEMASQGFGVCIIARNLTKMSNCLQEIKKKYPQVETKAVVCDFSKVSSMAEYRKIVAKEMEGMNIAVLGLNAGMAN